MPNIQQRGDNSFFFTVYTGKGPDGKYGRKTMTLSVEQQLTPKKLQEYVEAE